MGNRTPPRFKLGDRVVFSDTVVKDREDGLVTWVPNGLPYRDSYRMDEERRWQKHRKEFTEGVIVGQRSLAQYEVSHEEDFGEYGLSYGKYTIVQQVSGTAKKAWLVSYDLHRKPVLVLDAHVRKAPLVFMFLNELPRPLDPWPLAYPDGSRAREFDGGVADFLALDGTIHSNGEIGANLEFAPRLGFETDRSLYGGV